MRRSNVWLCGLVFSWIVLSCVPASAAVERYKTEAAYLARLAELGLDTVSEGFEAAVWDGTRSTIVNPALQPSVVSQKLLWEPASKDIWGSSWSTKQHGLSTNTNWARSGTYGVFENHLGEAYPTTIRVSSVNPIYAVGGWFDTNPDLQSVGILFEGRTTANDPGYVLSGLGALYPGDNPSVGHEFVGFVDPDGFTSVVLTGTLQINEENILEGGNIFGADDFTFGVPVGFLGDLNSDGYVGLDDLQIILDHWNQNVTPGDHTLGDPNGDGYVGLDDLQFVLDRWNAGIAATPAASAIPEPAAAWLLLGLIGVRHRHNRD